MRVFLAIILTFATSFGLVSWFLAQDAGARFSGARKAAIETDAGSAPTLAEAEEIAREAEGGSTSEQVVPEASFEPSFVIHGTVIDENGLPLSEATLFRDGEEGLVGRGGCVSFLPEMTTTDDRGRFSLPSGTSEVEVAARSSTLHSLLTTLKVGEANIVRCLPSQLLVGAIDADPEVRKSVSVEVRGEGYRPQFTLRPTALTGRFRSASLPNGPYQVRIRILGRVVKHVSVVMGRGGFSGPLDLGVIKIPSNYRMGEVTVLDPEGEPVRGYCLRLITKGARPDLNQSDGVATKQNGKARFLYNANAEQALLAVGWSSWANERSLDDECVLRPQFPLSLRLQPQAQSRFRCTFQPDIPREIQLGQRGTLTLELVSTAPGAREKALWFKQHGLMLRGSRWVARVFGRRGLRRTRVLMPVGEYRILATYRTYDQDLSEAESIDLGAVEVTPGSGANSVIHQLTPQMLERLRAAAVRK